MLSQIQNIKCILKTLHAKIYLLLGKKYNKRKTTNKMTNKGVNEILKNEGHIFPIKINEEVVPFEQ